MGHKDHPAEPPLENNYSKYLPRRPHCEAAPVTRLLDHEGSSILLCLHLSLNNVSFCLLYIAYS